MKIVVLIKQTPDTAELPSVAAEDVQSRELKTKMVINPWDEYAAEEAVLLSENRDAEALALSFGPAGAVDVLKHAIAMGVPNALLVENTGFEDADLWTTAAVLAAAIQAQGGVQIVLTGKQSVDDSSGALFAGVAAKLGYSLLTNVVKISDIGDDSLTAERVVEGAQETITVRLPVVISVAKEINDPRYPSFMGIRKANRAQIATLTPTELGIEGQDNRTQWSNIRKPAPRNTKVQIIEGASAQEKAAKLAEALLQEKVL